MLFVLTLLTHAIVNHVTGHGCVKNDQHTLTKKQTPQEDTTTTVRTHTFVGKVVACDGVVGTIVVVYEVTVDSPDPGWYRYHRSSRRRKCGSTCYSTNAVDKQSELLTVGEQTTDRFCS